MILTSFKVFQGIIDSAFDQKPCSLKISQKSSICFIPIISIPTIFSDILFPSVFIFCFDGELQKRRSFLSDKKLKLNFCLPGDIVRSFLPYGTNFDRLCCIHRTSAQVGSTYDPTILAHLANCLQCRISAWRHAP